MAGWIRSYERRWLPKLTGTTVTGSNPLQELWSWLGTLADAQGLTVVVGDHPDLDYRDVSPELQLIRGPYLFAVGVAAYEEHVNLRHKRQSAHRPGRPVRDADGGTACVGLNGGRDD